jgi:hypothetical protein
MHAKTLARAAVGGTCLLTFGTLAALSGNAFALALSVAPLAALELYLREL